MNRLIGDTVSIGSGSGTFLIKKFFSRQARTGIITLIELHGGWCKIYKILRMVPNRLMCGFFWSGAKGGHWRGSVARYLYSL